MVHCIASDAHANAPDTALTGELVSVAFEIDNTPPDILVQGVRVDGARTIMTFEVNAFSKDIAVFEEDADEIVPLAQWRKQNP